MGLTLAYNASGQLTSVTDYAGRVVTFTYNSAGLLASMALPLSRTVTYAYNASDQLTSVTNAAGGVTSYTYNAAGLLATVTDQNGHQEVANTYNASGQVISQVNALGKTATFTLQLLQRHHHLHRPQRQQVAGRLPEQRPRRAHRPDSGARPRTPMTPTSTSARHRPQRQHHDDDLRRGRRT